MSNLQMVVDDDDFNTFFLLFSEISERDSLSYHYLKIFLNIFDYLSLLMFILEILLKWINSFSNFWKNGWNIFDFSVTVMVSSHCRGGKSICPLAKEHQIEFFLLLLYQFSVVPDFS